MKKIILFVLMVFGFHSIQAQMNQIEFEEFDLENGLHVILHQNNTTPIAVVSVMYHVGSKNENPDRTGFAHFFEHLLFEGSENIGRGEYDSYVENAGGTLNANTTQDRTYYYEILPSNQLELGLWLESERMLHAKVEDIGIETQREVVKEEKRQRYDNQPYASILPETMERAFKVHPYQWSVIGSIDHLNAATEDDYKNFYADFYVPNNSVLSITGDIEIETTKKWVQKYFGSIPKGQKEYKEDRPVEPPLNGEIRDTIYDKISLPAVVQAYRIPGKTHEDTYALSMLSTLLSSGESSRLQKALVDEQQKALFIASFPMSLEDPSVNLAFGICNMGIAPDDLEKSMDAVYDQVKNELISEREYQKLRNKLENSFVSTNSSISGIAESLASAYTYHGDTNRINTTIDNYLAVTREDLQRVAQKYFQKDNRVVLYCLPKTAQ